MAKTGIYTARCWADELTLLAGAASAEWDGIVNDNTPEKRVERNIPPFATVNYYASREHLPQKFWVDACRFDPSTWKLVMFDFGSPYEEGQLETRLYATYEKDYGDFIGRIVVAREWFVIKAVIVDRPLRASAIDKNTLQRLHARYGICEV
jgi:hypothetical protein